MVFFVGLEENVGFAVQTILCTVNTQPSTLTLAFEATNLA